MRRLRASLMTIWCLCNINSGTCGSSAENISHQLQTLTKSLFENYDPTIRPFYDNGGPVVDVIQIYILSIDSVNEANMDYKMSMFFRQKWNDTRLMYTPVDGSGYLELDVRLMSEVWLPDVYIKNEKVANFHHVTVPNSMMYIYPDGTVYYSRRVTGTFSCFMRLHKYPLDEQICTFDMESCDGIMTCATCGAGYAHSSGTPDLTFGFWEDGHSADFMSIKWHDTPVQRTEGLVSPQFEIGEVTSYGCEKEYNNVWYGCIGFNIKLSRNYGYYLIQVYIPTSLIVMLSWVSFWLNIDAIPARISLGLLTVLTMTTMSSAARSELPRVSYVKAIDVWVAMCLLFVFAALIEFAHVNVMSRVEQRRLATIVEESRKKKSKMENGNDIFKFSDIFTSKQNGVSPERTLEAVRLEKARNADKMARIVFPLAFLVFNLIYWLFYLLWDDKYTDKT